MKKDKFGNIQQRIDKFKNKKSTSDKVVHNSNKTFNIAVEMVASKPIFLIICIILAMVAAFRSIWKKNIN